MSFDSTPEQRFPVGARISMIRDGDDCPGEISFRSGSPELTSVQGLVASGVE
jgi:hypothetical protein